MEVGRIAALWRYPVKSLRAEPLERTAIEADGIPGDRAGALVVESPTHPRAGKPYRGKESNRLHLTSDPETAASYAADAGVLVTLDRSQPHVFDSKPISLLVDLWVRDVEALVGEPLDPLRWRPNLFVAAAPGFARREPAMLGARLRAGSALLEVVKPIRRCVTTTYDVATGAPLPDVLARVAAQRDNVVGVYCEIVEPGAVARGDAVTFA